MILIYTSFLAMGYLSWQYLVPFRNPSEINCLLPARFRNSSSDSISREDTVLLFFTPVNLRTTLILVGVFAYFAVFVLASQGIDISWNRFCEAKVNLKSSKDEHFYVIYYDLLVYWNTQSFIWWNASIFVPGMNLLKYIEDERAKQIVANSGRNCFDQALKSVRVGA